MSLLHLGLMSLLHLGHVSLTMDLGMKINFVELKTFYNHSKRSKV